MTTRLAKAIKRLAAACGVEVRRLAPGTTHNRCSLLGSLRSAAFEMAAVGRDVGSAVIHVYPDLDGSLLYEEREEAIKGTMRSVAATTVDRLVRDHRLPGPFLLQADVQGAELAVVDGATLTLAQTELLVLEVTLFDFFCGAAPQIEDLVAAMGRRRGASLPGTSSGWPIDRSMGHSPGWTWLSCAGTACSAASTSSRQRSSAACSCAPRRQGVGLSRDQRCLGARRPPLSPSPPAAL